MGQAIPHDTIHSHEEKSLIRREVDRLIGNEHFRASKRNKRFLDFVVNETLSGRGKRIKAYTIAVDVFGRGMEFDPMLDPIVRIEATRLRFALHNFYDGVGVDSPLRVCMPKGKYVPTFVGSLHRDASGTAEGHPPSTRMPERTCALVEITMAEGLRSTDVLHLACDLTIESLKLCDVRVRLAPPEKRIVAYRMFEDFLKEPGSAYAVDILATGTSLFWRVTSLADNEIISRERLCDATGGPEALEAIQEITDRIAGLLTSMSRPCTRRGIEAPRSPHQRGMAERSFA